MNIKIKSSNIDQFSFIKPKVFNNCLICYTQENIDLPKIKGYVNLNKNDYYSLSFEELSQDVIVSPSTYEIFLDFSIEVPKDHIALIYPSGILLSNGISSQTEIVNSSKEIKLRVTNLTDKDFLISKGKEICKIVFIQISSIEIE